jgi:sulfatase modifying factor 1
MRRRTKTLVFFVALAVSSVLTFGNTVYAWSESKDFTVAKKAVANLKDDCEDLEEKRNELLEDYDDDHQLVKRVEDEIVALAKKYPSLLAEAHEQLEKDIQACDAEIAKCLEQGMKRTGKKVMGLESQKNELEQLLMHYPLNVVAPKMYAEIWRTFLHVTEEMLLGDETPAEEWSASFAGKEAGDLRVIKIEGVPFRFRWASPGSFMMGSPGTERDRSGDEVLHKVTLSSGFWMLETEVTQLMWESIMGENPSEFEGANLPVERVSWEDCQEFVAKLNDLGFAPAGARFALPTEAQWEYACRAGTTTPFSWGGSLNGDKANCDGRCPYGTDVEGKYLDETSPVGSYDVNSWGFFDMHGNVWEWCADWYNAYPPGAVTNPRGPANGLEHVMRGGCWSNDAEYCRSAYRSSSDSIIREDISNVNYRSDGVGFRLSLVPNN